jgi:hypothetical protein
MTAVVVVAAIVVVGAVVARVTWRRPADERHSIQIHQQTLDTLRSMADRRSGSVADRPVGSGRDHNGGAVVRPSRERPAPAHAAPARGERAGSVRTGPGRAPAPPASNGHSGNGLVFVDDATVSSTTRSDESARATALALSRTMPRAGRPHRRSRGLRSGGLGGGLRSGGRRRGVGQRLVPLVGAVVVLGIVVGLAVALAPTHNSSGLPRQATHTPKKVTHVSHTPPTTAPPPELQPSSGSSATSAVYVAPSTPYTVDLRATGLCWVQATEPSTGNVVWTGTLEPGQTRAIPGAGSLFLRLGAADDVTVSVNGEQVLMPTGFQSPFDMNFVST